MGKARNVVRHPLNAIFASEGHVRVLRALLTHGGALSPPEIARRVGMSAPGTRQVLNSLVESGVVVEKGLGRYKQYQVRHEDPLVPTLESAFAAEADRYDAFLEGIREAAASGSPEPRAVWLYGSTARGEDRVDSDVDVAVVFGSEPIEPDVERFREAVSQVTGHFGLSVSVIGLSDDDVLRLASGDAWWEGLARDARTMVGTEPDRYARELRSRPTEQQ